MAETTRSEEDERIRSYLVSQAERYDVLALWARVVADRCALLLSLDRVSEEQARWQSTSDTPGGWSILEVAQHMLLWGGAATDIVEALAGGDEVEVPELGALDAAGAASIAEVRDALAKEAVCFASLPERLPGDPDLKAVAEHPQFGPLNYRAWFVLARLHDGDHLRQMTRSRVRTATRPKSGRCFGGLRDRPQAGVVMQGARFPW